MKVNIINSTIAGDGESQPLPEEEWYYEGHPTVKLSDGKTYEYHPAGINAPQLKGNQLNHPDQEESDANWLAECSPQAKAAKEKEEKNKEIDENIKNKCLECLPDLVDYLASLPDAPQKLKDTKAYVDGEKVKKL